MSTMSYTRIDRLLSEIEQQRRVVDARLTAPARWRGSLRREGRRGPRPQERSRYAAAFDRLVGATAAGTAPTLDVALLHRLHADVYGGDGAFRSKEVRVGRFRTSAPAAAIPELVAEAMSRAVDGTEPTPLASARLHMELLLIHPWTDGNGRAVRLAATLPLLTAGYRSTLFTAVEQHSAPSPGHYGRSFTLLRASQPTQHEPWLAANLQMMQWRSESATAYRTREQAMRADLTAAGVDPTTHDRIMFDHDAGRSPDGPGSEILRELYPPWVELAERMHPARQRAFARQVERLVAEEADSA